jgi:hypothetical protein
VFGVGIISSHSFAQEMNNTVVWRLWFGVCGLAFVFFYFLPFFLLFTFYFLLFTSGLWFDVWGFVVLFKKV